MLSDVVPSICAAATETPRPEAYDAVPTGPLRLADPNLASQFAWLLPIALLGLLLTRRPEAASLALWGVWMLTYGIVYSAAGGIFQRCRIEMPEVMRDEFRNSFHSAKGGYRFGA